MLEEGKRSDQSYLLPAGPRNPVGVLWIGLNKPGIGIHGTPTGNRIDILDISKDGKSSKREELLWPTFAGRFRHLTLGPDGDLYVADEAAGMIYRVTPN